MEYEAQLGHVTDARPTSSFQTSRIAGTVAEYIDTFVRRSERELADTKLAHKQDGPIIRGAPSSTSGSF